MKDTDSQFNQKLEEVEMLQQKLDEIINKGSELID